VFGEHVRHDQHVFRTAQHLRELAGDGGFHRRGMEFDDEEYVFVGRKGFPKRLHHHAGILACRGAADIESYQKHQAIVRNAEQGARFLRRMRRHIDRQADFANRQRRNGADAFQLELAVRPNLVQRAEGREPIWAKGRKFPRPDGDVVGVVERAGRIQRGKAGDLVGIGEQQIDPVARRVADFRRQDSRFGAADIEWVQADPHPHAAQGTQQATRRGAQAASGRERAEHVDAEGFFQHGLGAGLPVAIRRDARPHPAFQPPVVDPVGARGIGAVANGFPDIGIQQEIRF
jgi:hypothetical protein